MEAATRVDVAADERGDAAKVSRIQPVGPGGFGQDLLDHERIDVDEGELQQLKREHADFLVVSAVGGHLAAFAKEDEVIGAVPVLDDVASFSTLRQ